jgi:Lrp/AsnC family transcriptional regulator for asnA, asnC and gidA
LAKTKLGSERPQAPMDSEQIILDRDLTIEKESASIAKLRPALDNIDRKILTILQRDARTQASEIARMTRINENTIRYRIKRLQRRGVIKEFTALLNPRMIGLPVAAIMMITTEPNSLESVFEKLARLEETKHILQATGKHDLIVVAHYENLESMNAASQHIRAIQGVKEAEIHLATGLIKVETKFEL